LLSDFLGNNSVYTKGLANGLDDGDPEYTTKRRNAEALCEYILEPLLDQFGPLSISYGLITPAISRRIVKYQDPDKPSHHLFNLGAAADVCVHNWVEGCHGEDVTANAPATLASLLVADGGISYPLSRLITYSESPYLCVAASAEEVRRCAPRMAVYENRYSGRPKVKPQFLRYNTPSLQQQWVREMRNSEALAAHGWRGQGWPSHHGGGACQYHHRRVSKYTMVSDWLFDLQTIATGARNNPRLTDPRILDAFAAAGIVYDALMDSSLLKLGRMSIVRGHSNRYRPGTTEDMGDWTNERIGFTVCMPEGFQAGDDLITVLHFLPYGVEMQHEVYGARNAALIEFSFEVNDVLDHATI
jgi:hypothetical protein